MESLMYAKKVFSIFKFLNDMNDQYVIKLGQVDLLKSLVSKKYQSKQSGLF